MKNKIKSSHTFLFATVAAIGITTAVHAALLVYEPFNYPVGALAGLNGGMGFSGGWAVSSGGPTAAVYDQTTTNVSSGAETGNLALTWNGKVNNLPSLPTVGARYAAPLTNNSNFEIHRTLATDAGTMAAANGGVLWLSAAYHWASRGSLGSGINIGLGSGYVSDRGRVFNPASMTFLGADGATNSSGSTAWNFRLNAFATASGWTAGQFVKTVGTNTPPGGITNVPTGTVTNDLIVVLKYTLSATANKVEACLFSENDTLSEAAFYASTNYVSAPLASGIDPTTLTVLSVAQGRMANAIDEIRIGQTFTDVISLPPAGPVDASVSTVTASPTNLFANGTSTTAIKVTLTDYLGIPVAGKSVSLASSPGNAIISPAGVQTTDANGLVTFTAKSTIGGTEVFTATDTTDSLVLSQTPSVLFTTLFGDADISTVVASPTNILANGVSTSTVIVTVKNSGGLPLAGKSVTLSSSPGNATISPLGAQTTGTNGQVTFTAKSTIVGTEIFTATDTTDSVVITQTASVEFSPTLADAGVSTVVASPIGVYANGSSNSTITVTMRNSGGLPLPGKSVALSGSPSIAILNPLGSQTTDSNGVAIYTAKSSMPGTVMFTATNITDSMVVTPPAIVNFVDSNAPIAINFNFYNFSGLTPTPEDSASLVGPNGGFGEVWNQTNSAAATNLLSSLGLVTSVGFTSTTFSRWNWGNPTLKMLHGGAAQFGTISNYTLTINGLSPGSRYNVWLASAKMDTGCQGTWSTANLTTSPTNQACNNKGNLNGSTWQYGNNYVFFEYVVADGSGQITFTAVGGDSGQFPVNGFQLAQTFPPRLTIAQSAGNLGKVNFGWNSKTNKLYDLVSANNLSIPVSLWPAWNGNTNILGAPPNNSLTNIPVSGSPRFFAIVERDAPPPLLSQNFEADDGGFFAVGSPNDWVWGAPLSYSGSGFILTNANGGSINCWGTSLGDGSVPSGLITVGPDSILQSPAIDFTTVGTAKLKFAAAAHAVGGDTIQVLVREVGTDALLVTLTPIAVPTNSGWTTIGPLNISAAAGKNAYLQFRFVGTDGSYCGLYLDDVLVTSY